MAEWYPEGLRSRVEQKSKVKGKKQGAKKKAKIVSEKPIKSAQESKPKVLLENYFSSHQGEEVSAKELAAKLGVNAKGIILILSQMSRKGTVEKTVNGKFRRSNKIMPISKIG